MIDIHCFIPSSLLFGGRAPGRLEFVLVDDRGPQGGRNDHRHNDHAGAGQPVETVALHGDEQVLFEVAGQHEADQGERLGEGVKRRCPILDLHHAGVVKGGGEGREVIGEPRFDTVECGRAVVDLAAMRDAVKDLGGDPMKIKKIYK